jgi:hypothetical protein
MSREEVRGAYRAVEGISEVNKASGAARRSFE